MIERYDVTVISQIWSLSKKYQYFLKVEQALLEALELSHLIPIGVAKSTENVEINLDRIDQLDKEIKHDVIAFCTSVTEQMPEQFKAFFHFGVTSSDIIDTALNLQLKESIELIDEILVKLIDSLKKQITKSENILGLGRSHGIYAEPMVYAQKWLGHLAEFARRKQALSKIKLTAQFSGAVGNYSVLTPTVEKVAAAKLGLDVEECSTQVIPRDRIASIVNEFSLIGCAVERLAVEIRHLHHSDINEVCEGFSANQKGSSTMPHKKNPISSENLTGLSRMLRSYSQIAYDNCLLWHERDISHSSAERMYLPDMFGIAYYALNRLSQTIDGLTYNVDAIEGKISKQPQVFSSLFLHELICRSDKTREQLYSIVQKACFDFQTLEEMVSFIQVETNVDLGHINLADLKRKYSQNFKEVYQRVADNYPELF